ncbi:hypothetical protein MUCCIDRAFT_114925 [Mucor lusitanicus CBS 277.49]|uniref:Uncharacterized protein n=1 Tax=Mucor lusitanicus CBS 277.49 TaxID=747725 RepID=A0A168HE57_MUCCL|nr:hypothetical protein MUCCIDRAFT_114925 [Mucor lusitanicus CBS 277.49]
MAINYFFRTSAKEWDIAEAIINYDQEDSTPEMSLDQLLLKIKSDLKTIGKTQASLNRYALRAVAQVDKLLQLRCLGVTGREPQEMDNGEHPTVNVNNISQNEQVNIAGVNNITMNQPAETDVGEGSSMYKLSSPSAPVDRPHKPKLRKLQTEALSQFIHFGTSFSQANPTSKDLYSQYKNEQKDSYSLKTLGLFNHVVGLLDINVSNHERTHFVENIIPSLLALGKTLDFIEFKWCESEFVSSKILQQKECDYDLRAAPSKYIDALGTLTTHNNMELIIVEASR